jgi:hypothetical protein
MAPSKASGGGRNLTGTSFTDDFEARQRSEFRDATQREYSTSKDASGNTAPRNAASENAPRANAAGGWRVR